MDLITHCPIVLGKSPHLRIKKVLRHRFLSKTVVFISTKSGRRQPGDESGFPDDAASASRMTFRATDEILCLKPTRWASCSQHINNSQRSLLLRSIVLSIIFKGTDNGAFSAGLCDEGIMPKTCYDRTVLLSTSQSAR